MSSDLVVFLKGEEFQWDKLVESCAFGSAILGRGAVNGWRLIALRIATIRTRSCSKTANTG